MDNYQYTSALMGETIETVYRTISFSSVFTEQSQICVTNAHPAMLEQGDLFLAGQCDPLFVPSVMKAPTPLTDDPAQEDLLQMIPRTSVQVITTKSCD